MNLQPVFTWLHSTRAMLMPLLAAGALLLGTAFTPAPAAEETAALHDRLTQLERRVELLEQQLAASTRGGYYSRAVGTGSGLGAAADREASFWDGFWTRLSRNGQ